MDNLNVLELLKMYFFVNFPNLNKYSMFISIFCIFIFSLFKNNDFDYKYIFENYKIYFRKFLI